MNNDRVAGWLTLGANIAVLIGIVLIVVELDQNRDSIRAQTRNEISSDIVQLLSMIASDGELANIRRRADAGEELSPDEGYRYILLTIANIRYWENVHYQYRQGLYDRVEFERQRAAIRGYIRGSARFSEYWCRNKDLYSPEFVEEVDALMIENACQHVAAIERS